MGQKDSGEKLLEDFADVFADIVNVLAFHGERLLLEENIVAGPTASIYKDAYQTLREQFTSDFQIIADYFCGVREGREEEFFEDIREFKHVKEMPEFFRIFSGDKSYEEIKGPIMEKAEKGEIKGLVKAYCGLIDEGVLTIEYAVEKMGLSISEFLGKKAEIGLI